MFPLPHASTVDLSLNDVLAKLSRHPAVDGLVTIGSTAYENLTPASDYDLLIILADQSLPFQVGITWIDHRLTDLLFASITHVAAIRDATTDIDGTIWEGRVARWLVDGQIVYDRHGRLHEAQQKVQQRNWIRQLEPIDSYGAWIGVNYNLLHTRRMSESADPLYQAVAELRITLYGIPNVLYSYFQVRQLHWEGDKAALRYLLVNDPAYADLLQRILREPDPAHKFAIYEQLADMTLAPLGGLWDAESTVLWHDGVPASFESIHQGLAQWEDLLNS
jgi:hypothetical protein